MRKRTVRKIWEKRNPIEHAMLKAAIPSRDELDRLLARELSNLEALVKGVGGLAEWEELTETNNLAEKMAFMGIGKPEVLPVAQECEKHLIEAAKRFEKTRHMGLTGPAIQAIREMLAYHDLQRASVSRGTYEKAIVAMRAKLQSGHVTIDLNKHMGVKRRSELV